MTYVPITPGTLNWDVPLNAALTALDVSVTANTSNIATNTANIATNTTDIAGKVNRSGDTLTGALNGVSFNVNAGTVRAAFLKVTSDTEHAVTIYQAATGTSPGSVALNVISDKPGDSAMFLTGQPTARGTLKITHLNAGPVAGSDANGSAISIDLQANGKGGTAAQGIFLTSTDGPTTGSLITIRNAPSPTIEEFALRADGKTGIRIPLGNTPQGSLEVRQLNVGDVGFVVQGVASATQPIAQFKNSGGTATLEVGASGAIVTRATAFVTGAVQLGSTSSDLGGSSGAVISMKNAATDPTTNPTGGVIVYASSGVLKARDASGNVVNLTKQTVTGSRGGNAALASLLTALATMGLITDSTTA